MTWCACSHMHAAIAVSPLSYGKHSSTIKIRSLGNVGMQLCLWDTISLGAASFGRVRRYHQKILRKLERNKQVKVEHKTIVTTYFQYVCPPPSPFLSLPKCLSPCTKPGVSICTWHTVTMPVTMHRSALPLTPSELQLLILPTRISSTKGRKTTTLN